jgi:predicted phage terminase large subunit-like protein
LEKQQVKHELFNKYVLLNKWILHKPAIINGGRSPQGEFLLLDCHEALYGGAAGGGKTDALLMAALRWVDLPGYNAIIFRKTLEDHKRPEGLIARTHQWLGNTEAKWNGEDFKWTFPSGATLSLGYMDNDEDVYHHQGAAYNFIGWDELTQFQQWQYQYLISRNRRLENCYIPLQIRAATNPGGRGHEWVKQYFLVEGAKNNRAFIPAKFDDNPFLDRRSYELALGKLDPVLRKQLREGSWEAALGTMFHRDWFTTIERSQAPTNIKRVRYWDMAATTASEARDPDYTAGALVGVDKGQYYIFDVQRFRASPKGCEDKIRNTAIIDGPEVAVWMEEEAGASGKNMIDHYAREVLPGFNFRCDRPTGSKEIRAGPFSAAAERKNIFLVRGDWNNSFLDELEAFPLGGHDDQCDSCSGAINVLNKHCAPEGIGVVFPRDF